MWEPSQATLDIGLMRPLWWKGHRPRVRSRCESPKVPSDSRFTRNYCTHRPAAMPPGNVKENDLAVAWHGLQRMPNHPNRRLLARASGTGLEVPVTGPQWWVGGWGPRYLGPVSEGPKSLTEDIWGPVR